VRHDLLEVIRKAGDVGGVILADADLLTIPASRATFAGVTRRYG